MKFKLLLFCIVLSVLYVPAQDNMLSFPDNLYEKHDYAAFFAREDVNKTMNPANIDYSLLHAAIFYQTNHQRQKRKLKLLKFSPTLRDAAQGHSKKMVELKFFSHYNKKERGNKEPYDRAKKAGWSTEFVGENIAYEPIGTWKLQQSGNEKSVTINMLSYKEFAFNIVKAWMTSPGHKKNILSRKYSHLGCGVEIDHRSLKSKNKVPMAKVTQNFGGK